jgi:stage III sporulation protein AE
MKKRIFPKLFLILIFFSIPLRAGAARAEIIESPAPPQISDETAEKPQSNGLDGEAESLNDALPEEAQEILGDVSVSDIGGGLDGIDAIVEALKENGIGIFKSALKSGVLILTIILLTALACSAMSDGGPRDAVSLCGAIAVSAVAVGNVNSFIGLGMNTLYTLSDFSRAVLPTLCAAAVSAGAFTSASAKFAATTMFMDMLVTLGAKVIMPLISAYIAAVIAGAALGKDTLNRVADMLKWVCTTCLTLLVLAFTTYLSLTGIISGKADEVAARAAKSALGALLPVVGSVISDAAETLVAGAGILRNSVGVFGLLAIAAVCLIPILRLGAHYLVYKGTAALSEALSDKRMAQLVDGVGTAFGLVLGLVGAAGIMLFVSVFSSMRAVGAV